MSGFRFSVHTGQTGWDEPLKMLDESKDLREFLDKMKSANL
jgi:hypothetical protein